MSNVVGLDRAPVKSNDLDMQSADAATALRALLAKLDSGEIRLQQWLFIYDEVANPSSVFRKSMDSNLTLETAVYLMESAKLDLLLKARQEQ